MKKLWEIFKKYLAYVIFVGLSTTISFVILIPYAEAGSVHYNWALQHLEEMMDQYHSVFYIYKDDFCGGNHFIPFGWMEDWGDLSYTGSHAENVGEGTNCIKITYNAAGSQGYGRAGIYWQYPENNWGEETAYYDLSGASQLSFMVRCDEGESCKGEFSMGGLNNPRGLDDYTFQDSLIAVSPGIIDITPEWTTHTVDLVSPELFNIYTDKNAGKNNRYYPTGWGGDGTYGTTYLQFDDNWPDDLHGSGTCIKIHYTQGPNGWATINWQQPENNWDGDGGHGYDLTGATKLTFWAKADSASLPLSLECWVGYNNDSSGRISGGWNPLTSVWQMYQINLSGNLSDICSGFGIAVNNFHMNPHTECTFYLDDIQFDKYIDKDLSQLIGGFCWTTDTDQNPDGCTVYIDDVKYDKESFENPHFINSYVTLYDEAGSDIPITNVAWIYDNALAMLAFMGRGSLSDWERVATLADSFVYVQEHDHYPFNDHRLRDAYRSGDVVEPETGTALLPGWWDYQTSAWLEDSRTVGSSAGNLSWVMLALLEYYESIVEGKYHLKMKNTGGSSDYLNAAWNLGSWIVENCYSEEGYGGYTGGLGGWEPDQEVFNWKSTEHNLDIYVAFSRLAQWTDDTSYWNEKALHALSFVESMWNSDDGHFWTGTKQEGGGEVINQAPIPLDIQPWAILALEGYEPYMNAMEWAREHCWVEAHPCPYLPVLRGFDYDTDLDGVWFEGSCQMATADKKLKNWAYAETYLDEIRKAQIQAHNNNGKGIVAACHESVSTGFGWSYPNRLHIGATAWFIFAEDCFNPYWGIDMCETPHLIMDSGDYNGDGTSDIAIFRNSSGLWAVRRISRLYYGRTGDIPAPGDYDGDGTTEFAIFRESSGLWGIRGLTRAYFGSFSDKAIPGDYGGDGTCNVGIFRESSGLWAIKNVTRNYFGTSGDIPVPGDYSGDGTKNISIFRESSGLWAIKNLSRIYFGTSDDYPVPGDYNGDVSWEPGIFRQSSGLWAIRGLTRSYFGSVSDQPVPADYNGNFKDDIGIFQDSLGLWAIRGISRVYFGGSGDVPVMR